MTGQKEKIRRTNHRISSSSHFNGIRHLRDTPTQRSRNHSLPGSHNTLSRRHSLLPRYSADAHIFVHPCPASQPVFTTTAGQLPPPAPPPIVHILSARRRAACDRVYSRRPAIMEMIAKSCGLCPLATRNSYWTVSTMASCMRIWLRSNNMHLGTLMHSSYCTATSPDPDPRSQRTSITSVGAGSRSWGTNSRTRERISVVTVPRESQLQL